MKQFTRTILLITALVMMLNTNAFAQVGKGLVDPNVAAEKELLALPHMTAELVKEVMEERPFNDIGALDEFLKSKSISDEHRKEFYGKAFIHINLNTAMSEQIQMIPGAGKKMAREFKEYRPWKSWTQFDKEIGKYVDKAEVERLRQYLFIPLNVNTATADDFMTIPGVGKKMAREFEEYRPWKNKAQFEKEIGKYVDEKEVARLWRYMMVEEPAN